jgi:hypothetical protein
MAVSSERLRSKRVTALAKPRSNRTNKLQTRPLVREGATKLQKKTQLSEGNFKDKVKLVAGVFASCRLVAPLNAVDSSTSVYTSLSAGYCLAISHFFNPLLFASCTDTVKLLEARRGVLNSTSPYK